jgi:mannonate dehydratase
MKMTMRWYGPDDPVTLAYIRQVPVVKGIVSALHDLRTGELWPRERLQAHKALIESYGLTWDVLESSSVSEAIKLGLPLRDQHIDIYQQSLRNLASVGVRVVCYNFMSVFDWTRTQLAMPLPDGSNTLSYAQADVDHWDLSKGSGDLPGWSETYNPAQLKALLAAYEAMTDEQLMANLIYFLQAVIPVAEECGILMALHPDDPPWSMWNIPRIVTDEKNLARILDAVDSLHHGLTFCTGSLGVLRRNNLPAMIRRFGGRIHFVHARNVAVTGDRDFHETAHPSGDVPMAEVMRALLDTGFEGPIRPDHGRMIWGEQGRAGYGLYDRALGAMYLHGLYEGVQAARHAQ